VDADLDIEDTELSPGVRRMMAAVGHEAAFNRGREQLKLLAGLTVTTKAVERTAEAIGADIERRQQQEHKRAMQLELPIPSVGRLFFRFCAEMRVFLKEILHQNMCKVAKVELAIG
jgi:hypothetical protein